MHFGLSGFGVMSRNIQQFELINIVVFIVLSYHIAGATGATDYCSLCKPNQQHVACNNNGSYGAMCSADKQLLKWTNPRKEFIVKLHNRMRNKIALGQIKNYSSAAKMPAFQWSDELAYLAELNVRSCAYGHDECRATDKYRWAGQNIARRGNSKGYENVNNAIKKMVSDWFLEYKDANMDIINSYHDHPMGLKIGHFTVMVNEKNNAVGCAMIRHKEENFKYRYLVCNYGYTNIYGRPVYEKGPAASKCIERHPVYEGLCSAKQVVIPVP